MSDQTNTSKRSGAGAFILGGVVVALAVVAYLVFTGGGELLDQPDVSITVPGVGTVEGEVDGS